MMTFQLTRRKGVVIGALAVLALAIIGGSYALIKEHSQSAKQQLTAFQQ